MATWHDVRAFALAMPGAVEQTSRKHATWLVDGKLFVWERPLGKKDRKDLGDAAPDCPILGVRTADLEFKDVLLSSNPAAFFTIPHFEGYAAVLVRLPEISPAELESVIVEAWLSRAKPRAVEAYLAGAAGDGAAAATIGHKEQAKNTAVRKRAAAKSAASKTAASKTAASKTAASKSAASKTAASKTAASKTAASKTAASKTAASKTDAPKPAARRKGASKKR